MSSRYVCPKCGLQWQLLDKKDPDQCAHCHEMVRPFDEVLKEKEKQK